MKKSFVVNIVLSCCVFFILFGCASVRAVTPTDVFKPTPFLAKVESTSTISVTPVKSGQTSPTAEENVINTPILTTDEKVKKVKELLDTNGGCQLPCWWGITPDETTWESAKGLLEPLSLSLAKGNSAIPDQIVYFLTFPNPATVNSSYVDLKMTVLVQDNIVGEMMVEAVSYGDYSRLNGVLGNFGIPAKVFLGGEINPYERTHYFEIVLYYPEYGVFSLYGNRQDLLSSSTLQVCFDTLTYNALYLWSPSNSFEERRKRIFETSGIEFLAIEDATSLTSEKIYSTFTTEKPCVSTPAEIWPGYLK